MHIILFLYRKTRENTFGSAGQVSYTNFCAYVLAWGSPPNFHKIIESPNYLENILLMGHSIEEISMSRDIVIFLLQYLGFVINWKRSVLTPLQEIEFLGLKNNSVKREISIRESKN